MIKFFLLVIQVCCFGMLFAQVIPLKEGNSELPGQMKAIVIDPQNPANCEECNPEKVKIIVSQSYSMNFYNDNSFTLAQNISILTNPTKPVKSIAASLSYFEFAPENENCMVCNKNSNAYGNFNGGTMGAKTGTGAGTHSLLFSYNPPILTGNFPVNFNISFPETVNCCVAVVRFCIRYTITFEDCTVCSRTVCYERKKPGIVLAENPNGNNPQNQQP